MVTRTPQERGMIKIMCRQMFKAFCGDMNDDDLILYQELFNEILNEELNQRLNKKYACISP